MTTEDDYLLFEIGGEEEKIWFKDWYSINLRDLVHHLNVYQQKIAFYIENNRTLSILAWKDVKFKGGTHRAKLITGFYDTKKECFFQKEKVNFVPDLPILDFANKFYLVSLQGEAVHSFIGDQEYTPSIIANIDTMIMDNEAIIVNYYQAKPIKINRNTDSLKFLEMRLVDFMFQPVILKSPLFITIKIKPANDADVKAITAK